MVFDPEKDRVQNMACKKQGEKRGSGFFFVIQKEKRLSDIFSFKLQITSRANMVQNLKKIGLMQPYIL